MKKFQDFIRNHLFIILGITAGVSLVGGIVLIALAIGVVKETLNIVMFWIMGVLLILLAVAMGYFIYLVASSESESDEPNLFLYDSKTETNMPAENLNFSLVNKRMTFFMSHLTNNIREVWTRNLFLEEEAFDGIEELKSLLAYKMLYDLADKDIPALWELYLNADASLISAISEKIRNNGDEFGKYVVQLHAGAKGSYEKSRKFLLDNKGYIESKMFICVKNNIDKF